jgi:PPOX class probable F420-dependent enzyme
VPADSPIPEVVGPSGMDADLPLSSPGYALVMASTRRRAREDELTDEDLAILRDKSFAHLATLGPDGSPQTTPNWVDVDEGGRVLINTAEGRAKPRNIRRDPRVAISIVDPNDPYRALMIRGRVDEITNEGAEDHIDFLQHKYHGNDRYPNHDPRHPRVLIKVRPQRIARMGYGRG